MRQADGLSQGALDRFFAEESPAARQDGCAARDGPGAAALPPAVLAQPEASAAVAMASGQPCVPSQVGTPDLQHQFGEAQPPVEDASRHVPASLHVSPSRAAAGFSTASGKPCAARQLDGTALTRIFRDAAPPVQLTGSSTGAAEPATAGLSTASGNPCAAPQHGGASLQPILRDDTCRVWQTEAGNVAAQPATEGFGTASGKPCAPPQLDGARLQRIFGDAGPAIQEMEGGAKAAAQACLQPAAAAAHSTGGDTERPKARPGGVSAAVAEVQASSPGAAVHDAAPEAQRMTTHEDSPGGPSRQELADERAQPGGAWTAAHGSGAIWLIWMHASMHDTC